MNRRTFIRGTTSLAALSTVSLRAALAGSLKTLVIGANKAGCEYAIAHPDGTVLLERGILPAVELGHDQTDVWAVKLLEANCRVLLNAEIESIVRSASGYEVVVYGADGRHVFTVADVKSFGESAGNFDSRSPGVRTSPEAVRLFVKEEFKARELPAAPSFTGEYDVVVAGLGSGGIYAAWKAAKLGLKTLGVERMDKLGGQTTLGCVCGTYENQLTKLAEFETMAREAGFETARMTTVIGAWMEGRRVVGLRLVSRGVVRDVRAKIVIDSTGDASVARMAGCRVRIGRDSDHQQGATSKASILRQPDGRTRMSYGFYRDSAECEGFDFSSRILGYAARDRKTLGKRQVVVKATIMGAREEGHVVCEDTYTLRDALCDRHVANPILIARKTPFDLVRIDGDWAWENEDTVDWKEICSLKNFAFGAKVPYGTLVPKDAEGLLLAAKHFGVAHDAGGGLRMQSHMRCLGLAAAAAAKIALDRDCRLKDVPYADLRPLLDEPGMFQADCRPVDIFYRRYSLEPFGIDEIVSSLSRPYVHPGDWVVFTARHPGIDMAWAYLACWRTHLCGSSTEKMALADELAKHLDGEWGAHFALALGLMRDVRAVPGLIACVRGKGLFADRLKALAALRRFKTSEARAVFESVIADDARAFTEGVPDEKGTGFARFTRDYRRFQSLSYALFALKEMGADLSLWRKRPLVLKCGARDNADLAPKLREIVCREAGV